MLTQNFAPSGRITKPTSITTELVVIGGGVAGVCAAISAARSGTKVFLIQDRPVLGGNASSEVRLWILGATSHMGNNNRWSREGGIMDEILLENLYRNKDGNSVIFDTVLLEKVYDEPNITLLLNTCVYNTNKIDDRQIGSIDAFCSQNSTHYNIKSKLFCDASGDGIVAFQSGCSFRMGAESQSEFGEGMAPKYQETELLGHSIYFYSKDAGKPVSFVKPKFADIGRMTLDRIQRINPDDIGPRLWWIEFGGNLNTIDQSEEIKFELWKVVYGIWDHIKNSGHFEGVENLTLEWVGTIPGKRESRRFNGLYMLKQQDVVQQLKHYDAISYGGWAIDHHPGDGIYSERPPCTQYHTKGVYQIPLRCFLSQDIDNLFLAGRIISATHIAFGSSRVMATCGHGGQAVGEAVGMCIKDNILPKELLDSENIKKLQGVLNKQGHFIPDVETDCEGNLANAANLSVSSNLQLSSLKNNYQWRALDISVAQLLPLEQGEKYDFAVNVKADNDTKLICRLVVAEMASNYTPERIIEEKSISIQKGESKINLSFEQTLQESQYAFLTFMQNESVSIALSDERVSGLLFVGNGKNKAVSNNGKQEAPNEVGIDSFEFWIPERRPAGKNLAIEISPPINFSEENLISPYSRPFIKSNAWVADFADKKPELKMSWNEVMDISEIVIHFDTDFDHALESSHYGHPESRIPFCVQRFKIYDQSGVCIFDEKNNYQSVCKISFDKPISNRELKFVFEQNDANIPVSLFQILVF